MPKVHTREVPGKPGVYNWGFEKGGQMFWNTREYHNPQAARMVGGKWLKANVNLE